MNRSYSRPTPNPMAEQCMYCGGPTACAVCGRTCVEVGGLTAEGLCAGCAIAMCQQCGGPVLGLGDVCRWCQTPESEDSPAVSPTYLGNLE